MESIDRYEGIGITRVKCCDGVGTESVKHSSNAPTPVLGDQSRLPKEGVFKRRPEG